MPAAKPRTAVYIDGFNLYYGALKGTSHKWLDLDRYFRLLRPNDDLQCIRYFTAMVTGPKNARIVMGLEMVVVSVVKLGPTMETVPPAETALVPESSAQ